MTYHNHINADHEQSGEARAQSASHHTEHPVARDPAHDHPEAEREPVVSHDRVYDASNDSFPASDAPSWTGTSVWPTR